MGKDGGITDEATTTLTHAVATPHKRKVTRPPQEDEAL